MSKPVLLSGGNGKAKELAGTANGQFLVNNGSNEVVFSTATAPTTGQVPVWSGSAWAPGANGSTGTVTSVSSSTTLSGLSLTTTNGSSTPAIALTGTLGVANGGTGATTLTGYVKGSGTLALTASSTIPASDISGLSGTYAPLASPTFTGTVTIPAGASISGYAPLASPTFTGTPAAPTAASGTNTTQIATTGFVKTAIGLAVGVPNDVSGEVGGVPDVSTEIFHFRGARAWTLAATGHVGGCVTAPSAETTFDIYKNTTGTVIGTMVISTGGTMTISISASGATLNFSTTDVLFMKTRAAVNGVSQPYWTFLGTVQ